MSKVEKFGRQGSLPPDTWPMKGLRLYLQVIIMILRFMIMGKNYDVFKNPAGRAQEAISWGFASRFCFSHRLSKQGSGSWIQYPMLEIAK